MQNDDLLKNLENIEVERIYRNNRVVGYSVSGDKKVEDVELKLPIHVTVMILAYSRVTMSEALRFVDGYYNPSHCLLYQDTDSMLLRKATTNMMKDAGDKFIGGTLGKLEDEFPNDFIIAARMLAPKTYCLAILKRQDEAKFGKNMFKLAYKVRCKGIPHRGDIFYPQDYVDNFNASLEHVDEMVSGPVKDLKNRYYTLTSTANKLDREVISHIDIDACDGILAGKSYLTVYYGSINRFSPKTGNFLVLRTNWCHRSIGIRNWWFNYDCPRILQERDLGYTMTKCRGLEKPVPKSPCEFQIPMEDLSFHQPIDWIDNLF